MASTVVGTLRVLLEANAAKLESEFEKASLKMGAFDKFTQNTGRNLQRMVEQFSGQKIVTEAAKMAAAVERVGGVSTLTERELRRVSSTVEEATAKLRAMGAEVPPSIAKLHAEIGALGTKSQATTGFMGGLSGVVSKLGPLLPIATVAGAATALVRMGTAALQSADEIVKLSSKTGLSTDAIQRMQYVAGQTGTSVDALAQASFKLGVTMQQGGTRARDAIVELGLSFNTIRALKPEDQFDRIIKSLESVEDVTQRNALGVALFGRQFAEIAPAVAEGYSRIASEAGIAEEAQVRAAEAAGDAWERFKDRLSRISINIVGRFAQEFMAEAAAVDSLTDHQVEQYRALMRSGGDAYGFLIRVARERTEAEKETAAAVTSSGKAQEDYSGRILAAATELAGLDKATRTAIESAKRLGASAEEIEEQFNLSTDAVRMLGEKSEGAGKKMAVASKSVSDAEKAQERLNKELADFARILAPLGESIERNWFGAFQSDVLLDHVTLVAAVGSEMGKADKAAEDWAFKNGAVLMPSVKATGVAIEQTTKKTVDWSRQLGNLAQAFSQLAQIAGGSIGSVLQAIGNLVGAMNLAHTAGQNIKTGMEEIDEAGGGAAAKFTLMAANIGAYTAAMAQAVNTTNRFQAAMGGFSATSSFASGLGASGWASAALGVVGGVIGIAFAMEKARAEKARYREALFKTKMALSDLKMSLGAAVQAFPALRDEFTKLFNGPTTEDALERMGKIIQEIQKKIGETNDEFAGLAQQMIDAGFRIPAAFQPIIQKLIDIGLLTEDNIALFKQLTDGTLVDWRKMEDAAKRYGDWLVTQLGPAFDQLKVSDRAKQIVNDFDLMTRGGASVGSVLFGMRKEIEKLVNDSIRLGTALPANMKPWIQNLIDTGQLLDENGDAITDIGKIKFAAPIKTEFEILTAALQAFIDKLDIVISKFVDLGNVKLPGLTTPDGSAPPGGNTTNPGGGQTITPMAAGAIVSRPTLALIGERGPEIVAPLSALSRLPDFGMSGPGEYIGRLDEKRSQSGDDIAERIVEGINRHMDRVLATFDETMRIGLRDAMAGAV